MKVKHLIRELQKCGPELEVITEGCDCCGDSFAVTQESDQGTVTIVRSDSDFSREIGGPFEDYANVEDTPKPL